MTLRLEVGGGTKVEAGWTNVDPAHGQGKFKVLIQDGIDIPDNCVTAARASHVMEHIPSGDPRVKALNEVHRVLVSGGTFEIIVPTVGYTDQATGQQHYNGWQAWADPTHVSFWWYPESFWYLTGRYAANAEYGLRLWKEGPMELRDGWEARVVLVKP